MDSSLKPISSCLYLSHPLRDVWNLSELQFRPPLPPKYVSIPDVWMHKVRIRTILFSRANLGSQLCAASPGIVRIVLPAFRLHVALSPPFVLSSGLCASEGGCCRCIRAKYTLCAMSEPRSHALNSLTHMYMEPGTTHSSLSSGKQSTRPNKGAEKACAYARLAKNADLAQHRYKFCLHNPIYCAERKSEVCARKSRG